MNPKEKMCDPYREALNCARTHDLNVTTGNGNYFSGFAGFFRRISGEDAPNCFLEIGRRSFFQFMSLNFGENGKWTESSFVLIDGEFAAFQPPRDFQSLPRINFGWLLEQSNKSLDQGQLTTSNGIFVFAADSEVQLFYHTAKMTGF